MFFINHGVFPSKILVDSEIPIPPAGSTGQSGTLAEVGSAGGTLGKPGEPLRHGVGGKSPKSPGGYSARWCPSSLAKLVQITPMNLGLIRGLSL